MNKLFLYWLLNAVVQFVCMIVMALEWNRIKSSDGNYWLFFSIYNAFMCGVESLIVAFLYNVESCREPQNKELNCILMIMAIFNISFLVMAITAISGYGDTQSIEFNMAGIISIVVTVTNIIFVFIFFMKGLCRNVGILEVLKN